MAIDLSETVRPAQILRIGDTEYELSEGEGLRIQHGVVENPVTDLQVQVPQGRKWQVLVFVRIEETTA